MLDLTTVNGMLLEQEIEVVAATEAKVLITGDDAEANSLVAHLVHLRSSRRDRPFIAFNCESLSEVDLFGSDGQSGLLLAAHGGTLVLNHIEGLTPTLQGLILGALESGSIRPLGDTREAAGLGVRLLSTTTSLERLNGRVASGAFREDLFIRLNVLRLHVPSQAPCRM